MSSPNTMLVPTTPVLSRYGPATPAVVACGVVIAAFAACDGASVLPWTEADSAGITIVTNVRPEWQPPTAWQVAATPRLTIGVIDGPSEYQFFGIRSIVVLSDGRIVVANQGTNALRYYSNEGSFLFARGGDGEGPGEFRSLDAAWRARGDTVFASDRFANRVSLFDPEGAFVRSYRLALGEGGVNPFKHGLLDDHTIVAGNYRRVTRRGPRFVGVSVDSTDYVRYGADGDRLNSLASGPTVSLYHMQVNDESYFDRVPFLPPPSVAVGRDVIALGEGRRYEIRLVDADGRLRRVVRRAVEPAPVGERDVARYRAAQLAVAPDERARRMLERFMSVVPLPESLPAFSRIQFDAAGRLWVEEFGADPDQLRRWSVFTGAGRWLGSLEMPAGVEPRHITEMAVYGVRRNELDVEQVVVHDIHRPAG